MAVARLSFTVPCLLILLFLIPIPHLDGTFFLSTAFALPLEFTALLLYMRAIQVSPLSLTVPFLAFTPAFLVLTGRLILGEQLNLMGILGILGVTAGSYILNAKEIRNGILAPFRAIGREEGSWLMLVVSFLYSLTAAAGKKAVEHSSPLFFACFYFLILGTVLPLGLLFANKIQWRNLKTVLGPGLLIGTILAVMITSHMLAISRVEAAYMIAIKRTSILFSILYAAYLFKEENLRPRFFGALLMVLGVIMIATFK